MVSGLDPSALRAAREKAGLTQHELARLVGAAGGERVSRWELGTSEPRPDFLRRLAEVLKIPTGDFIHVEGAVPDLRALRLRAGLTATHLVERTNLSTKTYLRWESGAWTRLPGRDVIDALAGALGEPAEGVVDAFRESQRIRIARRRV